MGLFEKQTEHVENELMRALVLKQRLLCLTLKRKILILDFGAKKRQNQPDAVKSNSRFFGRL